MLVLLIVCRTWCLSLAHSRFALQLSSFEDADLTAMMDLEAEPALADHWLAQGISSLTSSLRFCSKGLASVGLYTTCGAALSKRESDFRSGSCYREFQTHRRQLGAVPRVTGLQRRVQAGFGARGRKEIHCWTCLGWRVCERHDPLRHRFRPPYLEACRGRDTECYTVHGCCGEPSACREHGRKWSKEASSSGSAHRLSWKQQIVPSR